VLSNCPLHLFYFFFFFSQKKRKRVYPLKLALINEPYRLKISTYERREATRQGQDVLEGERGFLYQMPYYILPSLLCLFMPLERHYLMLIRKLSLFLPKNYWHKNLQFDYILYTQPMDKAFFQTG
jgi:hypothetical protein